MKFLSPGLRTHVEALGSAAATKCVSFETMVPCNASFLLQNVRDWRLAMNQQNDGATVQSTTDPHDRRNVFGG